MIASKEYYIFCFTTMSIEQPLGHWHSLQPPVASPPLGSELRHLLPHLESELRHLLPHLESELRHLLPHLGSELRHLPPHLGSEF